MRLMTMLLASALTFTSTSALAEKNKTTEETTMQSLGTPITAENLVDVLEIKRVITNLVAAADGARWDEVEYILTDKVDTTIGATPPSTHVLTDKQITERWAGFFKNADRFVMHHILANERITFDDADNASVTSKGVIVVENTPAGEYAEQGGMLRGSRWVTYKFGLTRSGNSWKVNKVHVIYHVEEWDSFKPSK